MRCRNLARALGATRATRRLVALRRCFRLHSAGTSAVPNRSGPPPQGFWRSVFDFVSEGVQPIENLRTKPPNGHEYVTQRPIAAFHARA